jgi:hypothetical protein
LRSISLVVSRAHTACAALNVISIKKRGRGTVDAQPAPGEGGDTEARQQKARSEMQNPIYF